MIYTLYLHRRKSKRDAEQTSRRAYFNARSPGAARSRERGRESDKQYEACSRHYRGFSRRRGLSRASLSPACGSLARWGFQSRAPAPSFSGVGFEMVRAEERGSRCFFGALGAERFFFFFVLLTILCGVDDACEFESWFAFESFI